MKAVCYLRVARGPRGFMFNATTKPSASPLSSGSGYNAGNLVTRQFKLILDLPESAFRSTDGTVEITVPEDVLQEVVRAEAEAVAA